MLCAHCGNPIGRDQQRCPACGHEISAAECGAAGVSGGLQSTVAPSTSGKAIASLALAFFSWIPPVGIVAVVLGHVAHGEIERSGGRLKGTAMADAGFILGGVGAAIGVLFILSIVSNTDRTRIAVEQSSAVGCLRTLNSAETAYKAAYPTVGFACSLSQMGPAPSGNASSSAAGLIDLDLASGIKKGYAFTGRCEAKKGVAIKYQWLAAPLRPKPQGAKYFFCTDESGVIKYSTASVAACVTDGIPL